MPPRIIVFQPALPAYRVDFFRRVAERLGAGFTVRYAATDMGALTRSDLRASWAVPLPPIRRLAPGLNWQPGVLGTHVRRGDIVVVSGAPRNLSNMLMLALARLKGARTIWWGHYWSSTSKPHRFWLRLLLMKLANAVLFYTDAEVEAYRNGQGRGDRRPVSALNNGIDVEPIKALRAPYLPEKRGRQILFIGRLTSKAEPRLLLEAMADPRLGDVHLHVVGDGAERAALEEFARKLGVDGRITWHGGTTDERAIADIANRCRLFVYPGDVGLSLLHAMAYGLPAVVHDDRWRHNPEIAAFYRAESGVSFQRGTVAALAEAIAYALERTETSVTWSQAAIGVADFEYNSQVMAERFSAIVMRVAQGSADNAEH